MVVAMRLLVAPGRVAPGRAAPREGIAPGAAGFSLIGLVVAMLAGAMITLGAFSMLSLAARNQTLSMNLTREIQKSAIMKAALDNTVSNAGGLIAPPVPGVTQPTADADLSDPFDAVTGLLFGNCEDGSLLQAVTNETSAMAGFLLSGHGYAQGSGTVTSSSAPSIPSVTMPNPISVTATQISYDYLVANNGAQELCNGVLQISGHVMTYTVSSDATQSGTSACTPDGQTSETTSYDIGAGWSFLPVVTQSGCMGSGFPVDSGDSITALRSAENGLPSTQVSVCIPNL